MTVRNSNNILIYYLSGTGNTRRVSEWIREEAEFRGIHTRTIPIEHAYPDRQLSTDPGILLGIGMPAHGFTIP
ncbi:MAG: flavodoxin family protein [Spirochaetota bacterium]